MWPPHSFVTNDGLTPHHPLQELAVKLVAMDADRWANASTVGEVTQYLRDIKHLHLADDLTTLNYFLTPPKLVSEGGESGVNM